MITDAIRDKMKLIEALTKDLGDGIDPADYYVEDMGCPHRPPRTLPKGYAAIYVFAYGSDTEYTILKIGKANAKSRARFVSHHYGFHARSTLAKSLCRDDTFIALGVTESNVKVWMQQNLRRINVYLKTDCGKAATELTESVFHYAFRPKYEGNI
ncbi:MAG: hypothetical protein MJ078_01555 [Clostridia bacterium]|nr:hypothetical protein [Clostridia bacterium]